mmetsp:Transcript_48772/g.153082  ORF Transcript_48772/g.153082 Transcript_48772/m.153082 type:complete len:213 (-) Transcript_48772:534-1172(-)
MDLAVDELPDEVSPILPQECSFPVRTAVFKLPLVDVLVEDVKRFLPLARQRSAIEPAGVLLAEFLVRRPIGRSGPHELPFPMRTALHDHPLVRAGGGERDCGLPLWMPHVEPAHELNSVPESNSRVPVVVFGPILVLEVLTVVSVQDVSKIVLLKHEICIAVSWQHIKLREHEGLKCLEDLAELLRGSTTLTDLCSCSTGSRTWTGFALWEG